MRSKNLTKFKDRLKEGVKDKKTEEWGAVKFKPKSTPTHTNPFNQPRQFNRFNDDNRKHDRFQKNRDNERIRFNPVARDARPENATPWKNFKDEITYKQREEEQATMRANMDSEEGKKMLKQREMNYRKMLMEQKKQEPTTWEDFGEETGANKDTSAGKKNKKRKNKSLQPAAADGFEQAKKPDQASKEEKPTKKNKKGKQQKSEVDKTTSDNSVKPKFDLISQDVLKDFDPSKLNFYQQNRMRAILTKAACFGNTSLYQHVKDKKYKLKNKQLRKEQLNNKL